jgi:hypothetical protein
MNSPASSKWGALFTEHYPGGGGATEEVERLVPLLKAVIALSTTLRHPGLEDSARMKATAMSQCKTVFKLTWTVGIRSGAEVKLLTDRRQSFLRVMAEQGGEALSVRDAALDLADVLMGEMLNPIAALTRKTLGGTAEQADGLLADMVYALATEQKEASRGADNQREDARVVRCVPAAAGGGSRANRPDRPPAGREGVG